MENLHKIIACVVAGAVGYPLLRALLERRFKSQRQEVEQEVAIHYDREKERVLAYFNTVRELKGIERVYDMGEKGYVDRHRQPVSVRTLRAYPMPINLLQSPQGDYLDQKLLHCERILERVRPIEQPDYISFSQPYGNPVPFILQFDLQVLELCHNT